MQGLRFCIYGYYGTMFTHSRTSFNLCSTFIDAEQSIAACFNIRHKLYRAISKVQENTVLNGDVELDSSCTNTI